MRRWVCTVNAGIGPGQQVLSAGDGLGNRLAGQVGRGEPGHPEVGTGQHPAGQRRMQLPGGEPYRVSLGHASSMAPEVRSARIPAG